MADEDVFVYMGEEGSEVPEGVVRIRVHPSVTRLPDEVFALVGRCRKLNFLKDY